MWIVALESGESRCYIAGHPTADVEVVGSPNGQTIEHKRRQGTHEGAGWVEEQNFDAGNKGTIISGRTTRTFATIWEADVFAADLTGLFFSGSLVLLADKGGRIFAKRTASAATALVKVESQTGCAVTLGYTVRAGALSTAVDEDFNVRDNLTTPEGDHLVTPEGDTLVTPLE